MRDLIKTRLQDTAPQRPEIVQRPGWGDIPEIFERLLPKQLTPAAVLVPLVERNGELSVLLTQRAKHLKHHGGQISFPGGRIEDSDAGPLDAALRETEEEVGLPAANIEVAGFLDNYFTITGYSVTPVVGFYREDMELTLDRTEVDDAFEVPLAYLFDPGNHHKKMKTIYGYEIPYFQIPWKDRDIWGATASMIVCFYRTILEPGDGSG